MSDTPRRKPGSGEDAGPAETIGALLRAGDPYHGQSLDPAEATRLKARLRAAQASPSMWSGRSVRLAVAATVAALLAVWLARPDRAPLPAANDAPELTAAAEAPRLPSVAPAPRLLPIGPPAARRAAPLAIPAPLPDAAEASVTAAPVAAAAAPRERAARHLRFTAPGGTRIVWTLDPTFEPGVMRPTSTPPSPQPDSRQGDDLQ